MIKLDILNQKFNRLTVIEYLGSKDRHTMWRCVCECGIIKNLRGYEIKNGSVKSCGCLRGEVSRVTVENAHAVRTLPYGVSNFNSIYSRYQRHAKNDNRLFDLSKEVFMKLITSNCHYCGIQPLQKEKTKRAKNVKTFYYNGIDRIDNNVGYIESNCVSCCKVCNRAKRELGYDEFINWIDQLVRYRS